VSAFAATTINYHLANTYKFGAAPGEREYFDYITLDLGSRRLHVSHGTEVLVVNADTGKAEGKISGLKQSHGIAVADCTRGCAYGDRDGPRAPEAVRRRQGTGDVGGDECR